MVFQSGKLIEPITPKPRNLQNENNTGNRGSSLNKPNIEFVDIPGGTFIMGSPDDEEGRKNDEIRHEVTLSAFKMSKYCVTYEQYDLFCEATGRTKPWGRSRGNFPVTQVTWDFTPNAFGLYDMHGNMWEWTNDWYVEYNIDEKMNPKGPETGTHKVDRGGGFYDPAWRCRSACRGGGTPPGNRGAGLSFRIVICENHSI